MHVTVLGAEPYAPYNRVLLSDVVAGRADVAALALHDSQDLLAAGVDVRLGDDVTGVALPSTRRARHGDRSPTGRRCPTTGSCSRPARDPVAPAAPTGCSATGRAAT